MSTKKSVTDDGLLSSASKALIPRFIEESPEHWLRIRPSVANPAMQYPPILLRGTIAFDTDSPHLVIPPDTLNTENCGQVCHVYLCGTGCNPTESNVASWFASVSGDRGIATIALSYQWGPYADKERNEKLYDMHQGDNEEIQEGLRCFHEDVITGGSSSGIVNVTQCNSVEGRLVGLLRYLSRTRPQEEQWSAFLLDNEHIVTDKFVFSGHSQGSGHVCAIAKMWSLKKAVLLSGPQEYLVMTPTTTQHDNNSDSTTTTMVVGSICDGSSSWLDGPYATEYITAFMHQNEEQTADLIRANWKRIAPLQDNGNGRVRSINADTVPSSFTSGDRMFSSTIVPVAGDPCGGRPNHMSTVSDRNTPVTVELDIDDSNNNTGNERKLVPVYYDLIWTHLLLQDIVPMLPPPPPPLCSTHLSSRSKL